MGMDRRYGSYPPKGYRSWVWIMGYGSHVGPGYDWAFKFRSAAIFLSSSKYIYKLATVPCRDSYKIENPSKENIYNVVIRLKKYL